MNKFLTIALVAAVILFILVVFISPVVDMQPSALRAQQWLSFLFAIFSIALQLTARILPPSTIVISEDRSVQQREQVCSAALACSLRC